MRYIRRLDNPLKIRSFGWTKAGGLGEFDPTVYEEIEGNLPEGYEMEDIKSTKPTIEELYAKLQEIQAQIDAISNP